MLSNYEEIIKKGHYRPGCERLPDEHFISILIIRLFDANMLCLFSKNTKYNETIYAQRKKTTKNVNLW